MRRLRGYPQAAPRRLLRLLFLRGSRLSAEAVVTMTGHDPKLNPAEIHVIWAGGDSDAVGARRTISVPAIHMPTGVEVTHGSEKPEGHTRREARVARDSLLAQCLDELAVAVRDRTREDRLGRSTRRHG